MADNNKVNFRATPAMLARPSKESVSVMLKRDVERYYEALERTLKSLTFTVGEVSLMADAANGTLWEPHTVPMLWAQIADSLEDGLAGKWEVDGEALVARLRKLSYMESLAIVDALERWWAQPDDQREATVAGFQAVGFSV